MASEQSQLDCPICLEPFTSSARIPKKLGCLHNVCLHCAHRLIKNDQIQCPFCRHAQPATDGNQLVTHQALLGKVEEREKSAMEDVAKYHEYDQRQAPKPAADVQDKFFTQLHHICTIGARGSERGQLVCPQGVAVRPTGTLVVADAINNRVQELDTNGQVIRVVGASGTTHGCFSYPTDVTVDNTSGKIYVADQCNHRIQIFDHEGKYLQSFGEEGSGPGEFQYPTGFALDDSRRLLYVTDQINHRIQVFDLKGAHKRNIGNDTELNMPHYVCLHGDRLYVNDFGSHHIVVYSTNGNKLNVIGKQGSRPGEFDCPTGIAMDPHGRILVCDCKNHRIQILDGETGQVVQVFGSKGSRPGQYNGPAGLALTPSGQLVVSEAWGHRLQMFDFKQV